MKFLILFLISLTVNAGYLPESKIGQDTTGVTIHLKKQNCEAQYSEPCIKFSENMTYSKIIQEQNLEVNNVSCVLCDDEYSSLVCDEGWIKVKGVLSVYCAKFVPRHVEDDPAAKLAYDNTEQIKETTKTNARNLMKPIRDASATLTSQQVSDAIKYILKKEL